MRSRCSEGFVVWPSPFATIMRPVTSHSPLTRARVPPFSRCRTECEVRVDVTGTRAPDRCRRGRRGHCAARETRMRRKPDVAVTRLSGLWQGAADCHSSRAVRLGAELAFDGGTTGAELSRLRLRPAKPRRLPLGRQYDLPGNGRRPGG